MQGLRRHFLPVCKEELKQQADPSLPQMNAARGILESTEPSCLRCSCCGGGFVFSYVRLIERRGMPVTDPLWFYLLHRRQACDILVAVFKS